MTAASHAASVAVSGLSYPAFVAMGIPEALALPVAIAAAGGASWAMASRERVDQWTAVAALSAVSAWFFSWLLGVALGPQVGALMMSWLPEQYAHVVHVGALSVGATLLVSAVAISHVLPLFSKVLSRRSEGV
jgi:hypothetical protein